ncbi:MAG: histidine kinase dimerization/phosphoacceptor domain -containing protein [Balneolaceae bacterium]
MRLNLKLILGFVSVAALILIVGASSYFLNNQIKNDLINESRATVNELQSFSELTLNLQNSLIYVRNYLVEYDKLRENPDDLEINMKVSLTEEQVNRSLSRFELLLAKIVEDAENHSYQSDTAVYYRREMLEIVDSLQKAFNPYKSLIHQLFEIDEEDETFGDQMYNTTIEPYYRGTLLPIIEKLQQNEKIRVDAQLSIIQNSAESTGIKIILFTGIGFIIAMWLAYFVYVSIAKLLKNLSNAAQKIGDGDLDNRIHLGTNDELEKVAESINQMAERLSKSMVSKAYVNNILQSMGDMLVVADDNLNIAMVNEATISKLGYTESELIGKPVTDLIHESEHEKMRKKLGKIKNGFQTSVETLYSTKTGEAIPVILSHSQIRDKFSDDYGLVCVASDISAQKEAEKKISDSLKEKNILLAEIHHRVKNNLAVISGLLQMQIWNIDDERNIDALRDSQMRVQSIALVHEKLYQSESFTNINFENYIKDLASAIQKTYDHNQSPVKISVEIDDVKITLNQAIPLSLLLNELIVNAYKHAFNGIKNGKISIDLKKNGDKLILKFGDNGVGLPEGLELKESKALGSTLIKTLVQQLNGTFKDISSEKRNGFHIQVEFPAG